FVATHIGLPSTRSRAWMVSRLGENWFVALYCTQPYGWRSTDEAPEQRAHFPALADPRAHARLSARGCLGAAGGRRPGRLSSAGTADCVGRPVAELLRRRSHALRDPVEDRRA